MKKHTKPHHVSVSTPVVRLSGNQAIVERVNRILVDNNPFSSSEDWFLLGHIHLMCQFRRLRAESDKNKLTTYITRREDRYLKKEGLKSITSQDFLTLNQWIANQDSADKHDSTHKWVNNLIKRVEERQKQVKREAKRAKKVKNKDHHPPPLSTCRHRLARLGRRVLIPKIMGSNPVGGT